MAERLKRQGFYFGRRKPYTEIGITRVPCARCGKPSTQQWAICSNDNRYLGVCAECDILLNDLALRFFRLPNTARRELIDWYRVRMQHDLRQRTLRFIKRDV